MITPFGLFLLSRTPSGFKKKTGQDFQRLLDEILSNIPHIFNYINDILVASENPKQHLEDFKRVFQILDDNGMVVNCKKCVLGKTSLEFLIYKVDKYGILRYQSVSKLFESKSARRPSKNYNNSWAW